MEGPCLIWIEQEHLVGAVLDEEGEKGQDVASQQRWNVSESNALGSTSRRQDAQSDVEPPLT